MNAGNFGAFTTNFEDLYGLEQLPGLAVQRLMAAGYGFGGEGDWKTAALTRIMKVMAGNKGTSFMEDYTYHLEPGNEKILGAHMLEVCPTISAVKPRIEVHPLGIGGKASPARLIFNGMSGKAVCQAAAGNTHVPTRGRCRNRHGGHQQRGCSYRQRVSRNLGLCHDRP